MKKVVFREHQAANVPNYVLIDDEQIPGVMKGMQNPVGFWLNYVSSKTPMFVARGQILFILSPTVQEIPMGYNDKQIEAPKKEELSEEQKEANKKRYYSLAKKYETMTSNKQKEDEKKKQKAKEAQKEKERLGREKAKIDGEKAEEKYGN